MTDPSQKTTPLKKEEGPHLPGCPTAAPRDFLGWYVGPECLCRDVAEGFFNAEVLRQVLSRDAGFPLPMEPLRLQRPASDDPTPPDFPAGSPLIAGVPLPYWRCSTLLDSPGCGAVWLKERRVACPCGGHVGKVIADPGLKAWKGVR